MLFFCLTSSNCFEEECEFYETCISCSDNVSCNGIGCWLEFGMGDADYTLVTKECKFDYYEEHRGGWGNILVLQKCQGGLLLSWSHNQMDGIYLSKGWTGQTDKGLKISDSLKKFQKLYPNAKLDEETASSTRWISENTFMTVDSLKICTIIATLDSNEKITNLKITRG